MAKRKKRKTELDVSKHILVPKHIKVSDAEKKRLIEQYNISDDKLPKIRSDDPAVQNLDVKIGDLIKIIRKDPITGESVFYRVVVRE